MSLKGQKIMLVATGHGGDTAMASIVSELSSQGCSIYGFAGPASSRACGKKLRSALKWREPGPFSFDVSSLRKHKIVIQTASELRYNPTMLLTCGYVPGMENLWNKAIMKGIPAVHVALPLASEPPPQNKIPNDLKVAASILPLAHYYAFGGAEVVLTGHPVVEPYRNPDNKEVMDNIKAGSEHLKLSPDDRVIGLFPGSSPRDVINLLPIMTGAAKEIRSEWGRGVPVIGISRDVSSGFYSSRTIAADALSMLKSPRLALVEARKLLPLCDLAIAASGSIVFEAVAAGVPVIELCHRYSPGRILPEKLGIRAAGMCQLATPASRQPVFFSGRQGAELERRDMKTVAASKLSGRVARAAAPMLIDSRKRERTSYSLSSIAAALGDASNVNDAIISFIAANIKWETS